MAAMDKLKQSLWTDPDTKRSTLTDPHAWGVPGAEPAKDDPSADAEPAKTRAWKNRGSVSNEDAYQEEVKTNGFQVPTSGAKGMLFSRFTNGKGNEKVKDRFMSMSGERKAQFRTDWALKEYTEWQDCGLKQMTVTEKGH